MFGSKHNGWIGVDVGSHAVKVAQLRRSGSTLHLSSSAIAKRDHRQTADLVDDLRAAKALAETLRGSHAAATLSMASLLVEATTEETDPGDNRAWDQWSAGPNSGYTLSTQAETIDTTVKGLSKAGLRCEAIDGPPLAIARVLQLSKDYRPDELLLALDWGESSVAVVAAKGGQAMYTRQLKAAGWAEARKQLANDLALTERDVDRVLGLLGSEEEPLPPTERTLLLDALRDLATPVSQEITRSLEHLGGKLRTQAPTKCYVFGAAGTVTGLPAIVGSVIGIPTSPWQASHLSRDDSAQGTPDCLLAQAIALSALAWEATH